MPQPTDNDSSLITIKPNPPSTGMIAASLSESLDSTSTPWLLLVLRRCQRRGVVVVCSSSFFIGSTIIISGLHLVNPSQSSLQQPSQQSVTRADYQLLEVGMTTTDAQAALGRAIESSRDQTSVTYKWTNSDGSGIMAVFKDNRLISKQQSNLK